MHSRKIIRYPGMKPRFYKLKSTVDRENTNNLPTWLAWKTLSANPAWNPPPIWIPLIEKEVNALQRRSYL
jgi:hypothetical protein